MGHSHRAIDTVSPLAAAVGLTVDTSCEKADSKCFAGKVQALPAGATLVVAWEHKAIASELVPALDVPHAKSYKKWPKHCDSASWPEPSSYDGGCYDAIWQVTLSRKDDKDQWKATSISSLSEGFGGSISSPCAE